jgi:hypothetical protein
MAVGVDQHPEVVRRLPIGSVRLREVRQPHRHHRLPQAVLHRLSEAQVRGVRHGGHELGDPHTFLGHAPILAPFVGVQEGAPATESISLRV